jgi:hypothetical protein
MVAIAAVAVPADGRIGNEVLRIADKLTAQVWFRQMSQ